MDWSTINSTVSPNDQEHETNRPKITRQTYARRVSRLVCSSAAAFFVYGSSTVIGSDEEWTSMAPMPVGRQELYTDTRQGQIYTAGGLFNKAKSVSDLFNAYDPKTNKWISLTPLPEARHHVSISIASNRLYAIGGFTGGFPGWQAKASVYTYSFETQKWTSGPNLPVARGEHVSVAIDGKIYAIGGRVRSAKNSATFQDHRDTARVDVLDTSSGQWTQLSDAPTERNSAAAAVINGNIYVVGGRQFLQQPDGARRSVNLATLEIFNPEEGTWKTAAPMPQAQGGLSAAAVDGQLYVFGGEQWVPEKKVFGQSWAYNPATDKWRTLPSMLTARHGTAAAAIGQKIFVFGGAVTTGAGEVATNEALSISK